MAIRKSAAGTIHQLIAELADPDQSRREAAAARLAVIGERAVSHLIDAFRASSSSVARVHMLQVIESTHDRRGLTLALQVLGLEPRDPAVTVSALHLLGTFVDDEGTEAVDALGAVVLDEARPEAERLAAWSAIARMPARTLTPIRKRLEADPSAAVQAAARQQPDAPAPSVSLASLVDAVLSGGPVDPAALAAALPRSPQEIPIPALHQMIEEVAARERAAPGAADRQEWLNARAAVHQTLAGRGSRVALYDVRDTLASASGPLPQGFLVAAALVGDASCLERIAEALARIPDRLDRHEQEWRDQLVAAGRAIVSRERLTRRQAVVRRLARKHQAITRVLFAPAAERRAGAARP